MLAEGLLDPWLPPGAQRVLDLCTGNGSLACLAGGDMALALAGLCSALAYILYFRLLARIGPTSAASVTFLVPVFASAWGAAVLGETVTPAMLVGGAVILAGTSLVLGLLPRRPAERAPAST